MTSSFHETRLKGFSSGFDIINVSGFGGQKYAGQIWFKGGWELDLLRSPTRPTIPYDALFRISQGFFSIYYLLSVSIGHFLGLTCNSEEKSNFAGEDDIRETVVFRADTQGDLTQIFPTLKLPFLIIRYCVYPIFSYSFLPFIVSETQQVFIT